MTYPRSLFKAAVLAAPLGAMALSAQAADIVGTIKEQPQLSKLAEAIEQAGMAQSLQSGGPYTIFAPTDRAFEQLPQGALDELMKEENQDQLETLLQYHVVEGEELMAKDIVGQQTEVDTLAGDSLSVDGSGHMVLLVPTGLTVTRAGDQVIVERDVAAVTAPEVEVAPAGQTPSQSGQQTEVTEQGDMPATEHQQQVLGTDPATEPQQTAPQDSGMPSSPHQEQALRGQQPGEQESGQQQMAGQSAGEQEKGVLREATVIEPDIQADNGVIHAIDAVLVPQTVLSKLESMGQKQQSQGQQGEAQQSKADQG